MKQETDSKKKAEKRPAEQPKSPSAETQAGKAGARKAEGKGKQPSTEKGLQQALEETQKQLKESKDKFAEQKDVLLRTAAEYDNFRKRTAREKESLYADATADTIKEMLSVEDNLERALEQKNCSAEDLRKGVEMTQKQMRSALQKLGVTEMGKEGDPFDPALHSAVAHVEDKSLGDNVVAKVFQKGYQINGKVIRHAMVQVAN